MVSDHSARILVVEDDPRYVRVIKINLEASQYEVVVAPNGEKAIELIAEDHLDLILLDVFMPGMDGYEVCRRIRGFSNVPIIFLTASADTVDKVRGLDDGANDYITKPFSMRELLARIRVQLRQSDPPAPSLPAVLHVGELTVDFGKKRLYRLGVEIKLTHTEYTLFALLARQVGHVLMPEYLLSQVWGPGHENDGQLLWQVIHRLRQKIEPDPANPCYIQTRASVGYIFEYLGSQPDTGELED